VKRLLRALSAPAYLREITLHLQLWWRLLRDPRVPRALKLLVPALAVVYVLWPADLIPDLLPLIGQLDDAAILLLALTLFESLAPKELVAEHLASLRGGKRRASHRPRQRDDGEAIDVEYRVL